MNKNLLYRSIPKVDILLADEGIKVLIETYSRESVMEAIHSEMENSVHLSECVKRKKKQKKSRRYKRLLMRTRIWVLSRFPVM